MVNLRDVVDRVAVRGAASLDDLESDLCGPGGPVDGADVDEFVRALDACVDHGYLRLAPGRRGGEVPYRVTARGRRLLVAASRSLAAA